MEYFAIGRNRAMFLDRAARRNHALVLRVLIAGGLVSGLSLFAFAAGFFFGG